MHETNLNHAELLNINKIKYLGKSANQLGAIHDICLTTVLAITSGKYM